LAIVDKNDKNWYIIDRDEDTSIGLTLPLTFDHNNPSKTTLEAVKQNLLNLCNTEVGERVMQPNLGVKLKRFLFEPYSEDLVVQVQSVVMESINFWLPFINIVSIDVKMSENQSGDFASTMNISIDFNLKKDPESHESVQIDVGE
tara:strand:+ start:417 stop:851 length:435 start_codon:yes stop_codon:yes gene_type:complete